MSRPSLRRSVHAAGLAASFVFSMVAMAADAPRDEFTAKAGDYDAPFGEASAAIKQIILDEGFEVVGVADFTDLAGQPLQIGRLYAEEFATRLVGPRKKYRLLDPATLLGLVDASGGTSLWTTPEKIRQFGAKSKVELVVTGRIEIAAKEARFFIKAIATEDAGVVWAKTIAVPGVSAAAADAAAKAEADALAAQTKLVPQPMSTDATGDAVAGLFTGGATAPAGDAAVTSPAATPTVGAMVAAAAPPVSAPAASVAVAATVAASASPPAPKPVAAPAPAVASPRPTTPSPVDKSNAPAAAAMSAPVSTAAAAASAVAATAAVGAAAVASTPPPVPKPVAAPPLPPEVLTFENAWLRARVRSASKYEGSGWVTAVLDLTNLSDRPIKLDAAQDDPGKGVDELGNNWRIERVSGLKLANGTGTANTTLNPSSTVSVVVVLATSAQPSGRRLSFGPNLYWFGSAAVGDSGRVAVAFSNIRVN